MPEPRPATVDGPESLAAWPRGARSPPGSAGRPAGPGAGSRRAGRGARPRVRAAGRRRERGRAPRRRRRLGDRARAAAPLPARRRRAPARPVRHRARTGIPHVRQQVPERLLTTWLAVDVSPSMAFGTADRLKSDVAEGVVDVLGALAVRRGGRVGLLTFGGPSTRLLPPRGGRGARVGLRRALAEGVAPDGTQGEPLVPRWCGSAGRARAAQPGRGGLGLRRPDRLGAPARGARRAAHRDGGRGPRPARAASCPRSAGWRWSTPSPARASRSTPPTGACASASRAPRARSARRWRPAAARGRRARDAVDRGRLGARARPEARVSFASPIFLAALGLVPLAARRLAAVAPARAALRGALPGLSGRSRRCCPRPPPGGAGCRSRCSSRRSRCSPWRWPGRTPPWRCPRSRPRSCSSRTCRARCWPRTSSRAGSRPPARRPSASSTRCRTRRSWARWRSRPTRTRSRSRPTSTTRSSR